MPQPNVPPNSDWATFFFRDSRALFLLIGMIVVSGLTSIAVLPRMEDPVLAKRVGLVATRLPGADAKRIESLVTEPLEDRLQDIEEIKQIKSESRPGISTITIELLDEITATDQVWSKVRGKIDEAIAVLPDAASRPVFEEMDVRAYAMIVGVTWDFDGPVNWALLRRYAKLLEDVLQEVPGTEVVDRFADPGEEITVAIKPEKAAALGLSGRDVADQLRSSDAKQSAGLLRGQDQELILELANQFEESAPIADTLIQSGVRGQMTRVGDIATISRGVPDPLPRYASINGKPAVALGAMVRNKQRIDLWRVQVGEQLAKFEEQLPAGLKLDILLDQNQYVASRLSSLAGNLVLGAMAVVMVVLALMGWRSALVVAMALPLSGLTVLFGLRVLGIPIHQMSITGMIIAIGLLIDNAIVVVDEVVAEIRAGHRPIDAVGRTVRQLMIPLAGSTVTTALAFAPIAMMPGPAGEFVGSIAISVMLAIFASLFFSLTVIPVVAAKFVGAGQATGDKPAKAGSVRRAGPMMTLLANGFSSQPVARTYRHGLSFLLAKPMRAFAVSAALPLIGFGLFSQLSEQFFPAADRDQFHVLLELPSEATIASTERAADKVTELLTQAGARKVSWFFGESAPVFYYNITGSRRGVPNFGSAIVQMDSPEGLRDVLRDLQVKADQSVPAARVLMLQLEQGPPFAAPLEVRLFGPDLERLQILGDQVRVVMASVGEVTHTKSLLAETLPTVTLNVDEAAARSVGLSPADVSDQLFGQLEGADAGRILEETEQIPVRVRVGNDRRASIGDLSGLELTRGDIRVPVASVASVTLEPQIAVIPRMNRRRMNQVDGFITAGTLPATSLSEFQNRLDAAGFELPTGYSLEYGGEASQRNQAVGNLMANVGVLVVMMIATLVLSFRSFRLAAVILVVAVASVGLGMIGLWLGSYPFGFMAIIGTMGLIGVAINDSIVVLAALRAAKSEPSRGGGELSLDEVTDVTVKCTRHVMATTLTTIAGFTPLIINGGLFWPPLAVAIAGGVSGATLLALCFVPAAYRLIHRTSELPVAAPAPVQDARSPTPIEALSAPSV